MKDGTSAAVKVATPEDYDQLIKFLRRLSEETLAKRFFTPHKPDEQLLKTMMDSSDPTQGISLIVERFVEGHMAIIAMASYFK